MDNVPLMLPGAINPLEKTNATAPLVTVRNKNPPVAMLHKGRKHKVNQHKERHQGQSPLETASNQPIVVGAPVVELTVPQNQANVLATVNHSGA